MTSSLDFVAAASSNFFSDVLKSDESSSRSEFGCKSTLNKSDTQQLEEINNNFGSLHFGLDGVDNDKYIRSLFGKAI
jgi:hypothetical protein